SFNGSTPRLAQNHCPNGSALRVSAANPASRFCDDLAFKPLTAHRLIELRHLRYFVATAEALNFTRAAEKLHLSQPALTRQVKDLESELGVRLLDRTKQRVNLTIEGRAFLADAKRVLALSEEIVESVRQLSRKEVSALNVGYVADFLYDLLPATL